MHAPRVDLNAKGKATASHCCEFRLKWPLFNRTQYKIPPCSYAEILWRNRYRHRHCCIDTQYTHTKLFVQILKRRLSEVPMGLLCRRTLVPLQHFLLQHFLTGRPLIPSHLLPFPRQRFPHVGVGHPYQPLVARGGLGWSGRWLDANRAVQSRPLNTSNCKAIDTSFSRKSSFVRDNSTFCLQLQFKIPKQDGICIEICYQGACALCVSDLPAHAIC